MRLMNGTAFGSVLLGMLVGWTAPPPPNLGEPSEVAARAARIDALVDAGLARNNVAPNPATSDETFVRRAYLDVSGRIPTAAEVQTFLARKGPDRRAGLIDELLASRGFVSRQFNFWADVLRVKGDLRRVSGEPYAAYLSESLAAGKPYDDLVFELLTASGAAHARGNGATGYFIRDLGMPEDNMANTVRVFLGTRIECAQCHDHPFTDWKQRQFFEMAAFVGGMAYRTDVANSETARAAAKVAERIRREDGTQAANVFRNQILRPLAVGVSGSGTGMTRLPKDYAYEDGKPGDVVTAHALFGRDPGLAVSVPRDNGRRRRPQRAQQANRYRPDDLRAPQIESREAFARWLTSPDNPRFTTVIANRLWKQAFGRGLIEPVDDLRDDTVASNPELMKALEDVMIAVDFDTKEFLRVLYNTKAWQRQATVVQVGEGEIHHFPGPLLRRMTAEQMWDSLLTLVLDDVDATLGLPNERAEAVFARYEQAVGMSEDELYALAKQQTMRVTDPERFREMQRERVRAELEKRQSEMAALRPLQRELARARRAGDRGKVAELERELAAKGADVRRPIRGGRAEDRRGGSLVRASALPQPAPEGHLVRQFGQSDRDQIESSHAEPDVAQVLSLMNGFVEQRILGDAKSKLQVTVALARTPAERVRAAYTSVLARAPSSAESKMFLDDIQKFGETAYRDLIWALINSHEFRFVQ